MDFFSFDDLGEVDTIKAHSLQIVLKTGGRIVLSTPKAASIRDLVSQFIVEARSGQFEYARVVADFTSGEENALQLSAGDIVAVVPKDDEYTQRGWLYGIKDGKYGLFPADFVDQLSPRSIRKEFKTISRITQQSSRHRGNHHSLSGDSPVDDIEDDVDEEDHYSGAEGDTWGQRGNYQVDVFFYFKIIPKIKSSIFSKNIFRFYNFRS